MIKGTLQRLSLLLSIFFLFSCQSANSEQNQISTKIKDRGKASLYVKKFKTIHGKRMAYIDIGQGDPIVFLHGNPTSSYLWRDVMPHLEGQGRLIAPDLIGMGDSEKLENSGPTSYSFIEHRKYLFALFEELNLDKNVTLVLHDWGSGLGFDWARQNADAIKGIVFMEAIVAPFPTWDAFSPNDKAQTLFKGFRSEAGEKMILQDNTFVEKLLLSDPNLSEKDREVFRRPYLEPGESRRPTLSWPRQIPIEGKPIEVNNIVAAYSAWLGNSNLPKLFINAEPGAILTGDMRKLVRSWPNLVETTVPGQHFIHRTKLVRTFRNGIRSFEEYG
jgi:haloalkane dehalogenase